MHLKLLLGGLYLILLLIFSILGKHITIMNSSRILPWIASWISHTRLLILFNKYIRFLLLVWKFMRSLRHFILWGSLCMFFFLITYRLYQGDLVDLVWITLLLIISTLFHELGHAISYASEKCLVLYIVVSFPFSGKTVAFEVGEDAPNYGVIGIAGGAVNFLLCVLSLFLLVFIQSPIIYYSLLINAGYFSSTYFSGAKDYTDVLSSFTIRERR